MTSVLDQMTAGITERKQARNVTLTPVGTEAGGPLSRVPNDTPHVLFAREGLLETAADLDAQAEFLSNVARDLRRMAGEKEPVEQGLAEKQALEAKLQQIEADRRAADRALAEAGDKRAAARVDAAPAEEQFVAEFAARMERLQEEAQAAVFVDAPAPEAAASGSPAPGWTCPKHGAADIREMTSRKGRKYRACGTCAEFEK